MLIFLSLTQFLESFSKALQLNALLFSGCSPPGPVCPHHTALSSADTNLMLASVALTAQVLHGKQGDTSASHRDILNENSPMDEEFCTC